MGVSLVRHNLFGMRKTLANPVFLACLFLAILNQILEKVFDIYIPLIHSYLDDLLCFPIVLTLGLALYRFFKPEYQMSLWHMLPVLVIYSVYFEWYLPQITSSATADCLDVVCYFLGSVLFTITINRPVEQSGLVKI